jgi:spore coat-associated protein N
VTYTRPLTRWMTLAALVAVTGCAVAASSRVHAEPAAVISQASGTFQITNSRDGQAIFQAQGLSPGRSVSGTVQLSNTGSIAGDLGLEQLDVVDQPGANGGRLSTAVQLDVQDITGGNLIPVFAGPLASLQTRTLGNVAPGEAHTYRFTASLPDGGTPPSPTGGDNAYAGSALSVRYSWKATAPDPGGGGGGGGGGTSGTDPVFKFRVVSKKVLKKGVLDVMASCDRACTVMVYAQLPKAKKRARKRVMTRRKVATLGVPNKTARIRLKLSKKNKRALKKALRKKKKVALTMRLSVGAAGGGAQKPYSKKVVVKRPKKKHARRH